MEQGVPRRRAMIAGTDYLNCPMNREEYDAFVHALLSAETAPVHGFEENDGF